MKRVQISLLVVGTIVLASVALVTLRPQALDGVLPRGAVSVFTGESGSRDRSDDAATDASLTESSNGQPSTDQVAADDGNNPSFVQAFLTGYSTWVGADIPAEITTIRPILGCRFTPPMDGAVVGRVTSGETGPTLALSTYNDSHLAAALQSFVDRYRQLGPDAAFAAGGPAYVVHDVAVTETNGPVYLVLENRIGNRIWNVHLAPGARIERVILLGGDQAGVANLDPVIPVEVILNDGLASCGIQPASLPNADNPLPQTAQGAISTPDLPQQQADAERLALQTVAEAYDVWFRDSFGVLARESLASFSKGFLSVIGATTDAGAPKAAYKPIDGARIRTTKDQFFEIKGQVAKGEDFAARVQALAMEFTSGDLTTLRQGVEF